MTAADTIRTDVETALGKIAEAWHFFNNGAGPRADVEHALAKLTHGAGTLAEHIADLATDAAPALAAADPLAGEVLALTGDARALVTGLVAYLHGHSASPRP